MNDIEIDGDIDAFIRSLESGKEEEVYSKREKAAQLDDMKVACWVTSVNYGGTQVREV